MPCSPLLRAPRRVPTPCSLSRATGGHPTACWTPPPDVLQAPTPPSSPHVALGRFPLHVTQHPAAENTCFLARGALQVRGRGGRAGNPGGRGALTGRLREPSAVRAQGPAEARLHGDLGPVTITPSFGSHGRHGLISLDQRRELTRLRPPWPPAPRTGRRTGGTHSRHSPAWTSPSLLTVSCQRGAWHRGERGDVVN